MRAVTRTSASLWSKRAVPRALRAIALVSLSACGGGGAGAPSSQQGAIAPTAVASGPLTILTGSVPNGIVATSFDDSIQATGGVAPYSWKVSSGTLPHGLSLVASTSDSVTIAGTPDTVAQAVPFTVQVTDASRQTASQPYTMSIMLQADSLQLSSAGLDFGDQLTGSRSTAQAVTLTNTAAIDMAISSIAIAPTAAAAGEFQQASSTCAARLAAGASCSVEVSFTPAQPGPRSAALTITDDTAGSPQTVALSGVGMSAGPNATLSVAGLMFGTQLVGTTSPPQSLALTNFGETALNVSSVATSGDFAETDDCVPSVASGATCDISVTFTPGGSGTLTGKLSIADDSSGSPQTVALGGTGSTTTPLLTGKCYALCRPPAPASECPAGQPAQTPGYSRCPVGPGAILGAPGTPVDYGRGCTVPPGGWQDRGYCLTQ